jgi:signal peptidase I
MKIHDCHIEEKPSESLMNNSTQSSALSPQSLNTYPALSPYYFEKICTELLSDGKNVRFSAPGKSMYPVILDGETLIVEPVSPPAVKIGDIILYKSEEKLIAHRVISIKKFNKRNTQLPAFSLPCGISRSEITPGGFPLGSSALSPQSSITQSSMTGSSARIAQYSFILRGDASYSYDEPVYDDQILGKVMAIERNGRSLNPYSFRHKLSCWARIWKSRIKRILF